MENIVRCLTTERTTLMTFEIVECQELSSVPPKKLSNSKSPCLLVLIVQSLEQRPVTEVFIEKVPNGNQADDDNNDDHDDADNNDDVDESNADEDDDDGNVFSDFDEDGK